MKEQPTKGLVEFWTEAQEEKATQKTAAKDIYELGEMLWRLSIADGLHDHALSHFADQAIEDKGGLEVDEQYNLMLNVGLMHEVEMKSAKLGRLGEWLKRVAKEYHAE
ncbi:MAG: hypothetical protein LIO90_09775 [Bacteroidales bacterium]|nr:hypothetical protein [Bacteroidales bacterium]